MIGDIDLKLALDTSVMCSFSQPTTNPISPHMYTCIERKQYNLKINEDLYYFSKKIYTTSFVFKQNISMSFCIHKLSSAL